MSISYPSTHHHHHPSSPPDRHVPRPDLIRSTLSFHSPSMSTLQPPSTPTPVPIHPSSYNPPPPPHFEYPYPPSDQYDHSYPYPDIHTSTVTTSGQARKGLPKNITFPHSHWQPRPEDDHHVERRQYQHQTYHTQTPQIPSRRMSDQPYITSQELPHSPHPIRATTFPPHHHTAHVSWSNGHESTHTRSQAYHSISHGTPEKGSGERGSEMKKSISAKRPREISINTSTSIRITDQTYHPSDSKVSSNEAHIPESVSTPMQNTFWTSTQPSSEKRLSSSRNGLDNIVKDERPAEGNLIMVPSILTRDKKQKACSNCRRAKLKCILEQGSAECIRCKSRKEKCVFFPRSQEDEVQVKIVRELYEATNHLSQLSQAVHHILYHLTEKKMIPPFQPENHPDGLDKYDPPEKPLPAENASRHTMVSMSNSDALTVGVPKGREKRRKINKKSEKVGKKLQCDELEEGEELQEIENKFEPSSAMRDWDITPTASSTSSSIPSVLQPPSQIPSLPIETLYQGHVSSNNIITRPPSTIVASTPLSSARLPPPSIPPNRPSSRSPPLRVIPSNNHQIVHPSIGQVLSLNHQGWNIGQPPLDLDFGKSSSRTRMSSPPRMSTGHSTSAHTSAVVQGPQSVNSDPKQNPSYSTSTEHTVRSSQPNTNPSHDISDSQVEVDENHPDTVIGSQDPRPNIVKKGLVTPKDALSLVNYFHKSLSPLMYGYPLEFFKFPYVSGPQFITPLLLAVLCLISSERISQSHHLQYHRILAEEVTNLLQTSPAESWQRFEGVYTADFGDPDGDEPLDAEFGLGPEEIVAACILATYMTEREQASVIARSAFRWARGWIKLLKSSAPRFTIAASVGFVPPERQATDQDMARIWLLCYIVDSTERLPLSFDAPPLRDALPYCSVLIPSIDIRDASHRYDYQDILLTFQARLMVILNDWRHRFKALISASQPPSELVEELKELVRKVNEDLVWWKNTFDHLIAANNDQKDNHAVKSGVGQLSTKHVLITFYFIKISVNSTLSKYLPSSNYSPSSTTSMSNSTYHSSHLGLGNHDDPYENGNYDQSNSSFSKEKQNDYRLKIEIKKTIIESAMNFVKICLTWSKHVIDLTISSSPAQVKHAEEWGDRKDLSNLSPTYLFFVTLMGSELVELVKESKENGIDELNIKADDVIPLLKSVGEMLFLGELNEQHVSRTTAKTLFVYCEKLQKLR